MALARYVRGLGWGMWLGDLLVDRLGGHEKLTEAPVRRVVERSSGVWLQLTDDPLAPVPDEVMERVGALLKPITPSLADVIAIDRTPAQARRIDAARDVDRALPFGFAVDGVFTHPDGTMIRGVVTHGDIPTIGTLIQVYKGQRRVAVAPLIRATALEEEPLVMLTLAGLDARRVPPRARLCTDPRVLRLKSPMGLAGEDPNI
jgi:hypothetical protein